MDMETQQNGDITVVRLCGPRLDAAQSVRFKEGVRALSDEGASHVVLDLSEVEFMDSSGLGAVVTVMKYLGREKTLQLAALTEPVEKVFRLTRMDRVFGIFASVEDALAAAPDPTGVHAAQ